MPEEDEIIVESREILSDSETCNHNHKANNKYKKIFRLFRGNDHKEQEKSKTFEGKKPKKEKKRKCCNNSDERKELFRKNMEESWVELPNTLKRKKEKISQAILSEFQHDEADDKDSGKGGRSWEKSGEEGSVWDKTEDAGGSWEKSEETGSGSDQDDDKLMENGQLSLEKIRKLTDEDYDVKPESSEEGKKEEPESDELKKKDIYLSEVTDDVITSLFYDVILEKNSNDNEEEKSGKSDTYVSQSIIFETHPIIHYEEPKEEEEKKEQKMERSESSDSLLNESSVGSSSASEVGGHQDDSGTDVGCDSPSKNFQEVLSDFERMSSPNSSKVVHKKKSVSTPRQTRPVKEFTCADEINNAIMKLRKISRSPENENNEEAINNNKNPENGKQNEKMQYSDLVFDNDNNNNNNQGFFVNKDFNKTDSTKHGDNSDYQLVTDHKIVYQELNFTNNGGYEEVGEKKHIYEEPKFLAQKKGEETYTPKSLTELKSCFEASEKEIAPNHMTEEEKAKKKSAEAIAKELSSKIFGKTESPNDYVQMKCGAKKQVKEEKKIEEPPEPEEEPPEENSATANNDLQYFSVADWRKAVAMGSKRGINPATMETIVEEPETDTSTKLTVREILRRFEELGNKHFSEKFFMTDEERTATLKQIHQTLKCLEEKVRSFEKKHQEAMRQQQSIENSTSGWTGKGPSQRASQSTLRGEEDENVSASIHDGKHSLLQFAIHHFRQSPEKFEMLKTSDGSISGSLKVIESKNKKNKEKGKGSGKDPSEWTWKEQVDLVKFTPKPIEQSLLRLDTPELSDLAVECFVCLMRYMGDLPMPTDVSEVKCVYTILMHCHKYEQLRDEVYCQLMKQTTNNKSTQPESCQRGWRLFSIVAAYFISSDVLKPFLFKYLETAAYDKRRAYHGTATVCLQNLRKTFKYGGRKNVPSVEEITAISAGRNSKRQIYRLPGGTEKVVNTKSTTVVQDVIEELCIMINVTNPQEMEEFSVYCIVEGDTFTMPLAKEEYILDVTTELHKNHQVFYLIFCRSVWYFPLRLDSQLYVEVVFNQIAPDYLEGLLLVMPGESLEQDVIYDIAKIAALLHRAADMTHLPSMKETKFLLPKPALSVRDVKPSQWVNLVQSNWEECAGMTTIQTKAQVLDVLSKWPLFGSSFFAVKKVSEPKERTDHILALNRNGVHFIDLVTHETLIYYPFSEVISTRKVKSEDGTLFLDMKCGNLMQQRITRLQTDQAHEISRLIRQYITMQQRLANHI